jgi:hypothetical protein
MPDTTFLIALAAAILGAASMVLHVVAPRTKTTLDDTMRDDIDEVLAWWRGRQAGVVPATTKPPASSGTAALLALVVLGLGAAALPACATARPAVATGAVTFLDCEDGHLDAQALADAKAFAAAEVQHWIAGGVAPSSDAIRADLAPISSDLGRCAIAAALAAVTAAAPAASLSARVASAAPPDGLGLRSAFAAARAELGWPVVRVAGTEL